MEAMRPDGSEEQLSLPKTEEAVELHSENGVEKPQAFSFMGGRLATEAVKKLPEAKLVHVEQAATRGEAVERLYELRQEVRDEPSSPPAPPATADDQTAKQQASSIGSVIAKLPYGQQRQQQQDSQTSQRPVIQESGLPASAKNVYGQAMRAGFIGGVLVVITFAILFIVT